LRNKRRRRRRKKKKKEEEFLKGTLPHSLALTTL
jgi:hypothetical protein